MNKQTRGGSRPNSGRKKGIETTTIRIPLHLKAIIVRWIDKKRLNNTNTSLNKN